MSRYPINIDSPVTEQQALSYFLTHYKPILDQYDPEMKAEVLSSLEAAVHHQSQIQGDPEQFLEVIQIYILGVLPHYTPVL